MEAEEMYDMIRAFDGAEIHRNDWPIVEKLIAAGMVEWEGTARGPDRAWKRAIPVENGSRPRQSVEASYSR